MSSEIGKELMRKHVYTVACANGLHKVCSGEGTDEDNEETVPCECPCHEAGRND